MSFTESVRSVFPDSDVTTGPFGLLGVGVAPIARDDVYLALRARLEVLDGAGVGETSAGKMVREALHVAAAQLADRELQDALLAQFRAAELVAEKPMGERAAVVSPRAIVSPELQTMLRHVLAASGGWNRRASKNVARFASFHGMSPVQLNAALVTAARSEHSVKQRIYGVAVGGVQGGGKGGGLVAGAELEEQRALYAAPSDVRTRRVVGVLTALFLVGTVGVGSLTLAEVIERRSKLAAIDAEIAAIEERLGAAELSEEVRLDPTSARPPMEARAALDALLSMDVSSITADADAAQSRYEHAVDSLSVGWERLPPSLADNLGRSLRDVLFAASESSPALVDSFLSHLTRRVAGDVSSAEAGGLDRVLFAEAVVRLLSTGDLPREAVGPIREAAGRIVGDVSDSSDFSDVFSARLSWHGGVGLGQESTGVAGSRGEAFWGAWVATAARLDSVDVGAEPRFVSLLERVLAGEVGGSSDGVRDGVRVYIVRADAVGRERVLRALMDGLRGEGGRAALRGAVAGVAQSGVWLTLSEVRVPETLTATDRSRLLQLLAGVVGDVMPGLDSAFTASWWEAFDLVERVPVGEPSDRVWVAAAMSTLSESLIHAWLGEFEEARYGIDRALEVVGNAGVVGSTGGQRVGGVGSNGSGPGRGVTQWLRDWFSTNERAERVRLLLGLRDSGGPSVSLEFDVVAEIAVRPGDGRLRRDAARILGGAERGPALSALLKYMSIARGDAITAELVESLTGDDVTEAGVEVMHAAVVSSVAALRAEQVGQALSDAFAALDGSAGNRSGLVSRGYPSLGGALGISGVGRGAVDVLVEIHASASAMLRGRSGAVFGAGGVESGRLSGARLHESVWMRSRVMRLLGESIEAEDRVVEDAVRRIVSDGVGRGEEARSATEQILVFERAIAQLWALRVGLGERL